MNKNGFGRKNVSRSCKFELQIDYDRNVSYILFAKKIDSKSNIEPFIVSFTYV